MANVYRLGQESFQGKDAVFSRVKEILNSGPLKSQVTGRDTLILYDLLDLRADKRAELQGRDVIGFVRDVQPGDLKRTRCFWALLDNGKHVHFSVYKAVRLLKPVSLLPSAP